MIVAGFGFTSRATAESLTLALSATGYAGRVDVLACPDDKSITPAFRAFAKEQSASVRGVTRHDLHAATPVTQSKPSMDARQTGSVAEASALAAAGPNATLLVHRQISDDRMATCAIAQGPDT